MASILDKYGIKEVADVVFYELDSKGAPSAPALYLDSLKVSTIEQSAETVDATGGKGNVKLLTWDTNKEIKLTLEDALFSAKSLGIMFGGTMVDNGANQEVLKTLPIKEVEEDGTYLKFSMKDANYWISKDLVTSFAYTGNSTEPLPVATPVFSGQTANVDFVTFDLLDCTAEKTPRSASNGVISNGLTIDITSNFNANTYYITGDTYARNFQSGKDEFLQFIVPKGKVSAEDVSLTMEADGDPATFSMTVNCLKAEDGSMIKLIKYTVGDSAGQSTLNKGVASVLKAYDDAGVENAGYASNASTIKSGSSSQPTD